MSSLESENTDIQLNVPLLANAFPNASLILPGDRGHEANERYDKAGFVVAEIIFEGGESFNILYPKCQTPYTRAARSILSKMASDPDMPLSSYSDALDAIGDGTFDEKFGAFLKD
jgi:hypothetical protein